MDLLERYLAAVARQLPDAQKADVTAELRDLLMSQIEEKEAALRRPLDREELEALFEHRVHLFLHVKTDERWAERRDLYGQVGLEFDV